MATREAKREDLKARLIASAKDQIERQGVRGLRARDITQDAGCALGGLYNAFDNLQNLIIHVNGETLDALAARLTQEVAGIDDPQEALKTLALAYLEFSRENRALWFALFDAVSLVDVTIPDWHREQQADLVALIAVPLSKLEPDLSPEALGHRAQALFAAVHGIVTLSLEERAVGLEGKVVEGELLYLVRKMTDTAA